MWLVEKMQIAVPIWRTSTDYKSGVEFTKFKMADAISKNKQNVLKFGIWGF